MTDVETGLFGPHWFDRSGLDEWLVGLNNESFRSHVQACCRRRLDQPTNGDLRQWVQALSELPGPESGELELKDGRVVVDGTCDDREQVRECLMKFHPWRKGPFEFFGWPIETEWRSDWKWNRMADAVSWHGKTVLDVGGGNGYFGWRMLEAGAAFVLGIDPILRFVMQFEVMRRYATREQRHYVVPMLDSDLPAKLEAFDVVLSAGVLYHRTSPIDHLRSLCESLRVGGTLLLETLIVQDDTTEVLIPEDRYAQMRNVWFIPSVDMLCRWLRRTGFDAIEVIDVTPTTVDEQRSTEWMTFQSLKDFLNPDDPTRTIEGYPAPVRAILKAKRKPR